MSTVYFVVGTEEKKAAEAQEQKSPYRLVECLIVAETSTAALKHFLHIADEAETMLNVDCMTLEGSDGREVDIKRARSQPWVLYRYDGVVSVHSLKSGGGELNSGS